MTIFLAVLVAVLALALVGCVGFVCWGAVRIVRESVARSRSADETMGKNLPVFMQTASALSEVVDRRVRERVRIINSVTGAPQADDPTGGSPSAPIDEMPPIFKSGLDGETREIIREDGRLRRAGADDVRDIGIGVEIPGPPPVRQEAL